MSCQREGETARLQTRWEEAATDFIINESSFHLGFLPTEQPHPVTEQLSGTIQRSTEAGIATLLTVDRDIPPIARKVVVSAEFDHLVQTLVRAVSSGSRIAFSGCGSTGRLAIMLEEMWRSAWNRRGREDIADLSYSIMTGGDRALIRSVENFEDFQAFGARQVVDAGLTAGDVLIAISEGGETSSVIGTAWEALRRECDVFFVYNNPTEILVDQISRSQELISHPSVTVLDLFTGAMALTGSTRMQATTIEMLVLGIAIEEAIRTLEGKRTVAGSGVGSRLSRVDAFVRLLDSISSPDNLDTLARLARLEADTYRGGGRITYLADRFLLDIFSDTTERTPTFMLPPFRPGDDTASPVSWAFAKDPFRSTPEAWHTMLKRKPRGLSWNITDYEEMNAPAGLQRHAPDLSLDEIHRYLIGCEDDYSRWTSPGSAAIEVVVVDSPDGASNSAPFEVAVPEGTQRYRLVIASTPQDAHESTDTEENGPRGAVPVFRLNPKLPSSEVDLFHHLAVKLIFNTVSTGSMALMRRIEGSWMIQVDPTNKKLIDRGSRIISHLAGISYDEACRYLHKHMFLRERASRPSLSGSTEMTDVTSPVVCALKELRAL